MADVFEARRELDPYRDRLWDLIANTPALDWLILTKRPERMRKVAPWRDEWPANVWAGTTIENQRWADKRIPVLLDIPASVRFLSCEPLLGPVDIRPWLVGQRRIDWVIAGGESGHNARPMNPEWARNLRDQCATARTPFHFKQWGHWRPDYSRAAPNRKRLAIEDSSGKTITLVRLGKHAAGRELDGQIWDEIPRRP